MTGKPCCNEGSDGFSAELPSTAPVTPEPPVPTVLAVSLTTLRPGQTAMVSHTSLDPKDAALLRAMGLRTSARVRMCRLGEPCIVEVLSGTDSCNRPSGCACRIGLARPLAECVMVGPVLDG